MLPPIGTEFIAWVRKAITAVPADKVMIRAGSSVFAKKPTARTRGPTFRNTQGRHMVPGIRGLGMPELNEPVQGLEDIHFRDRFVNPS
jgi:hypothetical protein